ncbi:hypothetical protein [Janthinobacterium fluminis]|uniref:Uncharacterized protein n=1 Tax=Janthinobacterium fluminis TaxID=2987524 RepID=A0ABT5K6W9_9BURK|nr:hypothetical protein [Janthinobacterium fluminis]MDC8760649.1 hypothetical protein [Janthinobacterium fluminis]
MKSPILFLAAGLLCALAQAAAPAPDLDLGIQYYSRVLTPEGVTRESRYEEKMLRRPGHVWVERVLPKTAAAPEAPAKHKVAFKPAQHEHKEFNHVVIPRHLVLEQNKLRVEYVDAHARQVIAIPATEYENVNFDGSWDNSFYLLNPKLLAAMPLSKQVSSVPGARWREVEKNGVFQRVLWDEQKQIALVIESGDKAGTFYRRVDAKPQASLSRELPWLGLRGYGQKEYADFLD